MKDLTKERIIEFSKNNNEPKWMRDFRVKSFYKLLDTPNPIFGPELRIDINNLNYFNKQDRFLNIDNDGVIYTDSNTALEKYPDLFKKYFNKLVKYSESKYTSLNGALWSGGVFIYVPAHIKGKVLNYVSNIIDKKIGLCERIIIIVDEESELEFTYECNSNSFKEDSLNALVAEVFVHKNAKCHFITKQNYSNDIYNLVTKRANVYENASMEWTEINNGSKISMGYPSSVLVGKGASSKATLISKASSNQFLDLGAKMTHMASNTSSNIISKIASLNGGTANYRGTVSISSKAKNSTSIVRCNTLILDEYSKSDTIPRNKLDNSSSKIDYESTISKVSEEEINSLMKDNHSKEEAKEIIINNFIKDI